MVMATAGLCSGAMTSFAPDRRIAITYLLIARHAAGLYQPSSVFQSGLKPRLLYLMIAAYIVFTLLQLHQGKP
jgi:hypothetical protein